MNKTQKAAGWNFTNLTELYKAAGDNRTDVGELQIVRLAPGDGELAVDWLYSRASYNSEDWGYILEYRGIGDKEYRVRTQWTLLPEAFPGACVQGRAVISGLENGRDYELQVKAVRKDGAGEETTSLPRLAKPCRVPGTVVNYIHPDDPIYGFSGRSPASPSIMKLSDGKLLASHDVYWGKAGQNLTVLFQSADEGKSWGFLNYLYPCFWGKLFVHRNQLYMLATGTEYGALLIGRSDDGGVSWSEPVELMPAGSREEGGPHKAPMPVIEHEGRLWSAIDYGSWGIGGHASGFISASVDSDLLDAAGWTATPFLPYDPEWPGTIQGGKTPSLLEGNAVITPDGKLVNLLRYQTIGGSPEYGRAVYLQADAHHPEQPLTFGKVIDFHGNMSKFTVYADPEEDGYWSLVNRVTSANPKQRNILTLVFSKDLHQWELVSDVLDYEHNGWPEDNLVVGFQYVDWLFDNRDILYLSRTAIGGAYNYHNANYITFHRIDNFRELNKFKQP